MVVQNALCMVLDVDDDVVEAVPAEGADRRSQKALAWRLRRRGEEAGAEHPNTRAEVGAEDRVPVMD